MRIFTFPQWLVLIIFCILFNSCEPDYENKLARTIKVGLRSNNDINREEWETIVSYVYNQKAHFPSLITEFDEVDTDAVKELIFATAKKRRGKEIPTVFESSSVSEEKLVKPSIKIYIENSASMDGYVKGATDFEAALSDLLVQIQYQYNNENFDVNFINTKVYPSKVKEVNEFVEALEPSKAPYKVGDRSVSKLNEVFGMILENTSNENVSILVSDCIYSLKKDRDTQGALEFQKSLTKGVFLEKSKEFSFSTLILKMNSKFDGTYYNSDNQPKKLKKKVRPYYIWIFGSDAQIRYFKDHIQLTSLKGYSNSYLMTSTTERVTPFYTMLQETNTIGRFVKSDRKSQRITAIEEIDYEDGIFQFSIAVDLQNVPADEKFLMETKNYKLTTGFTLQSIKKIDKSNTAIRDFKLISSTSATHLLTIQTTNSDVLQDLTLQLSNDIPAWVENTNSINDTDIQSQLDKTFGLNYLIQGVAEAYHMQNPDNITYFEININIKK